MKNFIFVLLSVLFFFACQKEKPAPIPDPCENAYDLRSKPYINLYTGTRFTTCPLGDKLIHLDKYLFQYLSVNPNDEYEFCYIKKSNADFNSDLYKYNFCTGENTLLVKDVNTQPDWSAKNWILFTKGNTIWKVKSNGDSLTKLNNVSFSIPKWSPDGTKYLSGNTLVSESGKVLQTLSFTTNEYTWKDNNTIIYRNNTSSLGYELLSYDLSTNTSKSVFIAPNKPLGKLFKYNLKSSDLYLSLAENEKESILRIDNNWKSTNIGTYEQSTLFSNIEVVKDRLIFRFILTDTLTGKPCSVNYRQHIAIMNLDGTNKRQVLLPE